MRQQPLIDADEAGDRREVFDVVGQLSGMQRRIDDEHRLRRDHHAVAVGGGSPHHRRADGMIGAAAILDDHLLAPRCHEALRHQPGHGVAHTAGRGRHYDGDGLGGKRLGVRDGWKQAQQHERAKPEGHRNCPQSIFKLASRITLAHLTESFFRYSANASSEPGIGCTTIGSMNFA